MAEEKETWGILLVTVLLVALLSRLFYKRVSWILSPLIIFVRFLTSRYEKQINSWLKAVKEFFRDLTRRKVYD